MSASVEGDPTAIRKKRVGFVDQVVVPKASSLLAARLRDLVLSGEIAPGDPLPPERQLVADSGLSRTSVREALRILEVEGLVSTRPGRSGGSVVSLPGRASVVRSLELFVRTHGVRLAALLECRLAIEPFLAGLAAQRADAAQLQEIEAIHQAFVKSVDNVGEYKRLNLEWHLAIARASGNEALIALMEAISHPILDAAGYQQVTTDEIRRKTVLAHEKIMEAIAAHDSEAAFKRMQRHVEAYAKVVQDALDAGAIS